MAVNENVLREDPEGPLSDHEEEFAEFEEGEETEGEGDNGTEYEDETGTTTETETETEEENENSNGWALGNSEICIFQKNKKYIETEHLTYWTTLSVIA